MALQPYSINVASFTDSDAGGNNYYTNKPVYIYQSGGALASIYSDSAGASPIAQDGVANVTDSRGEFSFYIDQGVYYAEVDGVKKYFSLVIGITFDDYEMIDGSASNILERNVNANTPSRKHLEPNGNISSGTTVKQDWMFDPYEDDPANYRISAIYNYVGDPNGTGEGAVAVVNMKSAGHGWGNWPSMHFGYQDDSPTGTAMKLMFFDTTDTTFRTPMKGMWHEGKSVTTGDYITASNKIYVAASTGTTGATAPSHSSGTVSDGGVDWTFSYAPNGSAMRPCVVIGDRDDMPMFGYSGHRMQLLRPTIIGRDGNLGFADDSDVFAGRWEPSTGGTGDALIDLITKNNDRLRVNCDKNYTQRVGLAKVMTPAVLNSDTTPSINGVELIRLGNTVATTITAFDDGTPGQVFIVESTNGNTTISHNANIRTKTGANITMTADTPLMFLVDSTGLVAKQI